MTAEKIIKCFGFAAKLVIAGVVFTAPDQSKAKERDIEAENTFVTEVTTKSFDDYARGLLNGCGKSGYYYLYDPNQQDFALLSINAECGRNRQKQGVLAPYKIQENTSPALRTYTDRLKSFAEKASPSSPNMPANTMVVRVTKDADAIPTAESIWISDKIRQFDCVFTVAANPNPPNRALNSARTFCGTPDEVRAMLGPKAQPAVNIVAGP